MANATKKFLFLDTNIFEHFPPIDQIDWHKIADCAHVTLVVPLITVRELNRHKDQSSKGRLKRRATKALKQLSAFAERPQPARVNKGVDLLFMTREPLLDFTRHGLRSDMPDDYLIASAIEFAGRPEGTGAVVVVMTADLGLQLKLLDHDRVIGCRMPEKLRLEDEPDAEEKQTRELQEQIRRLQFQYPDIKVGQLEGEMTPICWHDEKVNSHEIIERVAAEKRANPYYIREPVPPPGYLFFDTAVPILQDYNDKLNLYFDDLARYFREDVEVRNWQAKTRSLVLVLTNAGGVNANDLKLTLTFPKGITVVHDNDLKATPLMPTRPALERYAGSWRIIYNSGEPVPNKIAGRNGNEGFVRISHIGKSPAGSTIVLHLKSLEHKAERFVPVNLHFEQVEAVHPFEVQYEVWMSNFPEFVQGQLRVRIRIETS